ncbi:MAG: hypothetical protein P8Q92_06405, partial [Pseudoprimorskyibacter sp.]|nr:hypothetical protein [Pseudoprimorskyibacter sp.]
MHFLVVVQASFGHPPIFTWSQQWKSCGCSYFVSKFDPTDGQVEPVVLYVLSLLSWFKDILVHPFVPNHAVLAL